jgi:hypothetical protein
MQKLEERAVRSQRLALASVVSGRFHSGLKCRMVIEM